MSSKSNEGKLHNTVSGLYSCVCVCVSTRYVQAVSVSRTRITMYVVTRLRVTYAWFVLVTKYVPHTWCSQWTYVPDKQELQKRDTNRRIVQV